MSGLDRLIRMPALPHPGANVGLLCHHASVSREGHHIVDLLVSRPEWHVRCLFTPEHGFGGNAAAGESVDNSVHKSTGLPIYSLYGSTRSPRKEWLQHLDILVTDLMDLGVRCYTYASTLMEMLWVCAEIGLPVWVLDRSTPLEGVVDGPVLDPEAASFVGRVPLPLVYGLSQGELARTLREVVPELRELNVNVIDRIPEIEAHWIPPSPAIVSTEAARCYPVTVWSEAIPEVWVDRGGADSFQSWAMPDFPSASFTGDPRWGFATERTVCTTPEGRWPGVRFHPFPGKQIKPVCLAHQLLAFCCHHLGSDRLFEMEGARPHFFDQLAGTSRWREQILLGELPAFMKDPYGERA